MQIHINARDARDAIFGCGQTKDSQEMGVFDHGSDECAIDRKAIDAAFEETRFAPKGWGFGINVA